MINRLLATTPPRHSRAGGNPLPLVIPAQAGTHHNKSKQEKQNMPKKKFHVYLLASRRHGTLYTGITGNLAKRVFQHKEGFNNGFTKKYRVNQLVYYEEYDDVNEAIMREKQIKKWRRDWKIQLIEKSNPEWVDLYYHLMG